MDNLSDGDFLSDLPLNLIHCILTLLPIRDAVRTCILSKQWRYIWTRLPHLVFDESDLDLSLSQEGRLRCLVTMVNNVLYSHQGPIQTFEFHSNFLDYRFPYADPDLWLSWLSTKEIQELYLNIYPHDDANAGDFGFQVHSSLYFCRKLTHLELSYCKLPLPFHRPLFGFPCLRRLDLFHVKGHCDVVETLVANSPLLEELILVHFELPELRISAPNLKRLHLCVDVEEISLYAPLVDDLSVTLLSALTTAEQQTSVCNYIKFLGGLTYLKRLEGCSQFLKYLSIGIESYNHSLVLNHLKSIHLGLERFDDKKRIAVVGPLIRGAPNLQVLQFRPNYFNFYRYKDPPVTYSDLGWSPNLTFNNLRAIRMGMGDALELEFLKILLRSSTALETVTLVSCIKDGILELLKMLGCCQASPNVKISLRAGSLEFCKM